MGGHPFRPGGNTRPTETLRLWPPRDRVKLCLTQRRHGPTVTGMPLYFLLLDAPLFHDAIRPALAAAWRQRTFEPCRPLAAQLEPAVRAFTERYHLGTEEPLLAQVRRSLPFDRHYWTLLAGEVLLYAAAEVPEIQVAPETLCCLLAPAQYRQGDVPRERFAPIQQAHYGT